MSRKGLKKDNGDLNFEKKRDFRKEDKRKEGKM